MKIKSFWRKGKEKEKEESFSSKEELYDFAGLIV